MFPMDAMLITMVPQAETFLAVGAGAAATMVAFVALAVALAFGTARELRRTSTCTVDAGFACAMDAPRLAA